VAIRVKPIVVKVGDTLQTLAARELGDVQQWRDLATLNGLRPPYIIPSIDEADRTANTLIWGDTIMVPSVGDTSALTGGGVYGLDPWVIDGQLIGGENGDLALAGATENLGQALQHRIYTPYRSYLPHPTYGCEIHGLLGIRNRPAVALLAAGFVRLAILRDPRAAEVKTGARAVGDRLLVPATVTPVMSDSPFDLNAVLALPLT